MLNPDQQEQLYPPTVLMQVEFGPQIDGSDKHSSTSVMAELAVILHQHISRIGRVIYH